MVDLLYSLLRHFMWQIIGTYYLDSPDHSQTCRGNPCFLLLKYHQVTDLHRHYVDDITIPSKRGPEFGVLKRVDDVSFFGP
jgi:hypothetical protein